MQFIRDNQVQLHVDHYRGLMNHLERRQQHLNAQNCNADVNLVGQSSCHQPTVTLRAICNSVIRML